VFWNELRDMIGFSSSTADSGLGFSYANIAQARSRGAEAMVQWSVTGWLSLGLGGTVTDARDLTTDKPLENQATLRGVSQLRLRWRQAGVVAFVRASVTGPRPLSDGETSTLYTRPFALVDARVAKTLLDWFEVFLSAQNLFGAGNTQDLPIAPRLVFGGLSFTY
jgi:outer membrane receptor for ferrienterochelin and colicins